MEQGQEFQRYKGVSFCVTFSFVWIQNIQKYRKKILSFFFDLIQNFEEYYFQNIQRNNSRTISTKGSLNIISRIQKAKVVIFKTIQLHSVETLIQYILKIFEDKFQEYLKNSRHKFFVCVKIRKLNCGIIQICWRETVKTKYNKKLSDGEKLRAGKN